MFCGVLPGLALDDQAVRRLLDWAREALRPCLDRVHALGAAAGTLAPRRSQGQASRPI
jgi:hypothetical protein